MHIIVVAAEREGYIGLVSKVNTSTVIKITIYQEAYLVDIAIDIREEGEAVECTITARDLEQISIRHILHVDCHKLELGHT